MMELYLSKFDKRTLTDIRKYEWYSTLYLPFALDVYQNSYGFMGKKLKLPLHHLVTYQNNQLDGLRIMNYLYSKYDKGEVAKRICLEHRTFLDDARDPLDFALFISQNVGNPADKFLVEWTKEKENKSKSKRTFKSKSSSKPPIPPEKCDYCIIFKNCRNKKHNAYWKSKH